MREIDKKKAVIIGAGQDGFDLMDVLSGSSVVKIVGVADIKNSVAGKKQAELFNIPFFSDYLDLLVKVEHDTIFDITGSTEIAADLRSRAQNAELISGSCATMIWDLIEEKKKRREETQRRLSNFEDLYRFGLTLSSSQDLREVNGSIIDFATKITKCPAGSLAILDEKTGEMVLGSSKGFSRQFYKIKRWQLRSGGLTSHILNQKLPVVISNLDRFKSFDNPTLISEKIKAIIAAPLTVEGKIVGILYVDDFVERQFSSEDVYALSLISTYAALAIERTKLLEDTRMMAITDGLTGLYNQKTFFSRLDEEVERAIRYNHPISLITFDIDYFKNYNDSQGHLVGNEALLQISNIVKEFVRQIDFCARCGGEEFAIIIPETDKREAFLFAERLRKKIESHYFKGEENQPNGGLTISIGVAGLPHDTSDGVDLMDKADQALYEAKHKGRNRVVGYEPGMVSIGSTCDWRVPQTLR